MQIESSNLIATMETAKLLGISVERVRQLVRGGRLTAAAIVGGKRCFDREAVLEFAQTRKMRNLKVEQPRRRRRTAATT